jgi:FixJ family two-component response regulator
VPAQMASDTHRGQHKFEFCSHAAGRLNIDQIQEQSRASRASLPLQSAADKLPRELSTQLGITVGPVETHRSKIMLKLNLHSVAELIH